MVLVQSKFHSIFTVWPLTVLPQFCPLVLDCHSFSYSQSTNHYNKAEVLCIVVMYCCLPLACVGSALIDLTIFQKNIIFPIYILYKCYWFGQIFYWLLIFGPKFYWLLIFGPKFYWLLISKVTHWDPQSWKDRQTLEAAMHCMNKPGPSCSKIIMSLVNVSLKLWSLNTAHTLIFLLKKMWVAFAFAKATHIFSAKIPVNWILYLLEQLTFWPLTSLLS